MIQDLDHQIFHNEYKIQSPSLEDHVFVFRKGEVLGRMDDDGLHIPLVKEFSSEDSFLYLFCIDQDDYYLLKNEKDDLPLGYSWHSISFFREEKPKDICFAGMTAYHLYNWYNDNRYCGHCGSPTIIGTKERSLVCEKCGNIIYPKISPAVIIGVTNGDKIVMSKYKGRSYKRYALLAGFNEIGETLEETVEREVMEEVGLKVKNITYYKSQPWGMDQGFLMGFFCEVDGDPTISKIDEEELALATWISRDEIDSDLPYDTLTHTMMNEFRDHGNQWKDKHL